MGEFAVLAALSLAVTKVVDTIRNAFDQQDSAPKVIWNIVAFAIGICVCVIFDANLLREASGTDPIRGTAGQILTGILMGAGGAAWHEVLDFFSSKAKEATPARRRRE